MSCTVLQKCMPHAATVRACHAHGTPCDQAHVKGGGRGKSSAHEHCPSRS